MLSLYCGLLTAKIVVKQGCSRSNLPKTGQETELPQMHAQTGGTAEFKFMAPIPFGGDGYFEEKKLVS